MLWPDSPAPATDWTSSGAVSGPPRETIDSRLPPQTTTNPPLANQLPATGTGQPGQAGTAPPEISLDRLQHALANIAVDEDGNLALDEVALASLQQAFRAVQSLDTTTIDELRLYVQAGLAGEAGTQAARLLDDYIGYRNSLAEAKNAWAAGDDLSPRQQLERTIALRREHMDPVTASQLFAGEEAHQRYLIAMDDIRSDMQLSEPERQDALARVREDLRSGRLLVDTSDGQVTSRLRQQREQWQQLGLTDDMRRHLARQSLGLVAARDLAGSDAEDWQSRYGQFERERDAILRAGLAEAEKRRQARALEERYFTPEEREAAENWLPRHLRTESVR